MNATRNSKPSLVRSKYLVIFLIFIIGTANTVLYWPTDLNSASVAEWKSFSTTMAGISATMVGFLCAAGALLYTVSNTPLVIYLRDQGIEKRILIDLFSATIFWLFALFFSLFSNFPAANINPIKSSMICFGFGVSGLISFFPIGYSLWMVLTNLNSKTHSQSRREIPEAEWTEDLDLS